MIAWAWLLLAFGVGVMLGMAAMGLLAASGCRDCRVAAAMAEIVARVPDNTPAQERDVEEWLHGAPAG